MYKCFLFVVTLCIVQGATSKAQEFNLGLYAKPFLDVPLFNRKNNEYGKYSYRYEQYSFSTGLSIQYNAHRWYVDFRPEFGIYFSELFMGNKFQSQAFEAHYNYIEPQLSIGIKIKDHDAKAIYKMYWYGGAGYSAYFQDSRSISWHNTSSPGNGIYIPFETKEQFNEIALHTGAKVRAILLPIGLIDYGLEIKTGLTPKPEIIAEEYAFDPVAGNHRIQYIGYQYRPLRCAIFLTYYFWNVDNRFERRRYQQS